MAHPERTGNNNSDRPKGKLMVLADAIRNLERPEMREEAKEEVWERVEKAMNENPVKFSPHAPLDKGNETS